MRKISIAVISIVLILVALLIAKRLINTAPQAERKRPPKTAALVKTTKLMAGDNVVVLKLTGTVTPAETIKLQSRVAGEVVAMAPSFIDGGHLRKGEKILQIDPVDYELALSDAESKQETARFSYKQELGRQEVARREWDLLKSDDATDLEKELALRIPHLAASKASLKAAEAAVRKAQINLERTGIFAPFNAVVTARSVYIGSQATLQSALGMLVGTDAYWITVSIPVDRLQWISIPGSHVRVISTSGTERQGKVIRLLGDLEEKGRMARVLVEVRDPLCIKPENSGKGNLLLGEYVRAEISGSKLNQVYVIPRDALRENSSVWIAANGKLEIRPVEVRWRDAEQVIIENGLNDGEMLIISDLTAPINGMDVSSGMNKPKPKTAGQNKPANEE